MKRSISAFLKALVLSLSVAAAIWLFGLDRCNNICEAQEGEMMFVGGRVEQTVRSKSTDLFYSIADGSGKIIIKTSGKAPGRGMFVLVQGVAARKQDQCFLKEIRRF